MSGAGRKPGPAPSTIDLAQRVLDARRKGRPLATVCEFFGIAPSYAFKLMEIAREHEGATPKATRAKSLPEAAAPHPAPAAPSPRRMSIGATLRRTWTVKRQDLPFRAIDGHRRELWTEIIMEIRQFGRDGVELTFGGTWDNYARREHLVEALQSTAVDIQALFDRRLLVEMPCGGIAMPFGFGLRWEERLPRNRASETPAGDLSDSTEMAISVESDSTEMPIVVESDSTGMEISVESSEVPHAAAAAAAKSLESLSLSSSSSSNDGRAGDSTEIPIVVESDSTEIPRQADSTDIKSERSAADAPAPDLAVGLAKLAHLSRPVITEDRDAVAAWQARGCPPETIKAAIEDKVALNRARDPHWSCKSLGYFDGAIRDAMKRRAKQNGAPDAQPPPAAAPAAPLSAEDQAIKDLLRPAQDAYWTNGDRSCPFPPSPDSYKAACAAAKTGAVAKKWPMAWDRWDKAGRQRDLKPPDFPLARTNPAEFERRMVEVLTEPDRAAPH